MSKISFLQIKIYTSHNLILCFMLAQVLPPDKANLSFYKGLLFYRHLIFRACPQALIFV